jgi:hypothetical protein
MNRAGLADDTPDGQARVQTGVGVLEDHLHALAQRPQRTPIEMGDVDPVQCDAPAAWR